MRRTLFGTVLDSALHYVSMICPIVCLTLCQECMLMIPIWLIRVVISTPFSLP